jgi:PAS domain S-box-containing protein
LDAGAPILVSHPERYFRYLNETGLPFVEGLVVPFAMGTTWEGTIWIAAHDAFEFDAEHVRVMTVLADLTATVYARNRANELRATYGQLGTRPELMLDQLPVGFVTIDKDHQFTYANAEAERFAAMPRVHFVGRVIYDVLPALRGSPLQTALEHSLDTGEVSRLDLYFPPHDRWYDLVIHPADNGGLAVFFHDAKLRKQHEHEALRTREESERQRRLYEAIHSSTPDFLYVWGPDYKFRYANKALLALYAISFEDCIGKGFEEVGYPAWHARMHEREIDEVIRTKQPLRGKIPYYAKGGGGIYDYIFVPVFGPDGNVEAVAGTTRDVTELDRTSQALRDADKRKDEFLATLAHELRNPLAPLRNGVELLAMAEDLTEVHDARSMMERQVNHMVHLVDDLLDLSRVSRGVIELRPSLNCLRQVLEAAVEVVRPAVEHNRHTLEVELPQEELPLQGDTTRLAQIFSNLLNNAVKYTAPGGHITLKAESDGDRVRVSVTDTGIGIALEHQHKVFDMFTQVDDPTVRAQGGLGIGLHIVKRLVEMHQGKIEVSSAGRGMGSTFTVTLPLSQQQNEEHAPATPISNAKRRVMIVDDNVDAAFLLSMMLKKKGHEVHATYGAHEALTLAEEFRPEVILMDIGMPELNGYDACKQLRTMPELKGTRIIAITGWGQEEDRRKAREAGFDEHLVKPVNIEVVEAVLGRTGRA